MHMTSKVSWFVLAAFAGMGCSQGPSSPSGGGGPTWTCGTVPVPLGETTECTSSTSDALTYDGTSATDGPAYYCAPSDGSSSDCPPPSSGGTNDGTSAGGAASGGATTGGSASGGGTSDGTAGGGGASGGGASDGPAKPGPGGGGAAGGPGGGGSSGGTGGGVTMGTGTSDGTTSDGSGSPTGDGFYCTKQVGKRVCKKAPHCEAGAHRVQMDCEPDASFGGGASSGEGSSYPGCGSGDGSDAMPGGQTDCFYPAGSASPNMPAATAEYVLEAFNGAQVLHVRLTFNPTFVDNSYGASAVGWNKGHKFNDLVGSDHAELTFLDTAGTEKIHFKLDYISQSTSAPSGYACLGVLGGEGRMILGNASDVVRASSSLDRNLNDRGYKSFLVDSPATTSSFAPPANAPAWDYRVVYEAWVKNSAFGSGGFGSVQLAFVHASPSKLGTNTLPVSKGTCPPSWNGSAPR